MPTTDRCLSVKDSWVDRFFENGVILRTSIYESTTTQHSKQICVYTNPLEFEPGMIPAVHGLDDGIVVGRNVGRTARNNPVTHIEPTKLWLQRQW